MPCETRARYKIWEVARWFGMQSISLLHFSLSLSIYVYLAAGIQIREWCANRTITHLHRIEDDRHWNRITKTKTQPNLWLEEKETLNTFAKMRFCFSLSSIVFRLSNNEHRRWHVWSLRMMSRAVAKTYTPFFIVIALLFSQFAYLHLYWWTFPLFLFFTDPIESHRFWFMLNCFWCSRHSPM